MILRNFRFCLLLLAMTSIAVAADQDEDAIGVQPQPPATAPSPNEEIPLLRRITFIPFRWLSELQDKIRTVKNQQQLELGLHQALSNRAIKTADIASPKPQINPPNPSANPSPQQNHQTSASPSPQQSRQTSASLSPAPRTPITLRAPRIQVDQDKVTALNNYFQTLDAKIDQLSINKTDKSGTVIKDAQGNPVKVFDDSIFKLDGLALTTKFAQAVGPGMYAVDVIGDSIIKSPIYKLLQNQGYMPNSVVFKSCLRSLMLIDPILTKGWLMKCAGALFAVQHAPELLKNSLTEYFNPDTVNLGDSTSLFKAHRIDSLAAIPAIAELLALKATASAVAAMAADENTGQGPDSYRNISDRLMSALSAPKASFAKLLGKVGQPSTLANKAFWKNDLLTIAKYARVLAYNVISYRVLQLDNPSWFSKIYKYTLGLVEPRTVSFALSTAMLKGISEFGKNLTPIVDLKQFDHGTISNFLVRPEYRDCLIDNYGYNDITGFDSTKYTQQITDQFKMRPLKLAAGRFALQTVIERVLSVVLDKLQKPVASLIDDTFEIKMLLAKLLKLHNPLAARQQIHQMFFKMTPDQQKQFELNLAQHLGVPFKIVVGKDGLQVFVVGVRDGQTVMTQIPDQQLFGMMAEALGQPTMIIKSERGKIVSKMLAQFLTAAVAAPLAENLIVKALRAARNNKDDQQLCFETRGFNKSFWSSILSGAVLSSLWIGHGLLKNWIELGVKKPAEEFKTNLFE